MKRKVLGIALVSAALAMTQSPAYAVDTGIEWLKVSGYGTLALSHSNLSKSADVYVTQSISSLTGLRDSWTGSFDSRAGVQVSAQINPSLSAVTQFVSARDEMGTFRPRTEWAYLSYNVSPNVTVRAGRVGLPAFLTSDYLRVGYSQPWIRPPIEVYSLMPVTHVDGMDALFRFNLGEGSITVQPAIGKSEFMLARSSPKGAAAKEPVNSVKALGITSEYGAYTFRYAKAIAESTIPIFGGIETTDNFNNVGMIYDKDNWLVQSEYVWRKSNNARILGYLDSRMGYMTLGYRIGKVMPHVTFARFVDLSTRHGITDQNSQSIGVRWDFYKNMALKVQADRFTRPDRGTGLFNITATNAATTGFRNGDQTVKVISAGIDFVF